MDCSLPGSSVHEILQARMLESVAGPFPRGSSQPGIEARSPRLQVVCLPSEPPGKNSFTLKKKKIVPFKIKLFVTDEADSFFSIIWNFLES